MIRVRKSGDRGHFDHGWLDTYHTFSFAGYQDPAHMGFRSLRVINEDRVAGGQGFGEHGHRDMEILSYVPGGLAHTDSLGHEAVLRPGEVQRITAGTGVRHSEFNASPAEPVHFFQVWLLPERPGLPPGYEQKAFPEADRRDRLRLAASWDGRDCSVAVHQDADLYLASLGAGVEVTHRVAPGRHAWVQVACGRVELNGEPLGAGDGASVSGEPDVTVRALTATELLLFDLA